MAPSSKQANRGKAGKKAVEEDEPAAVQSGSFVELAKSLALGSVLATLGPKVPQLVTEGIAIVKGEKVAEKKTEAAEKPKEEEAKEVSPLHENEDDKENEAKTNEPEPALDFVVANDVCATFKQLSSHLHWSCPLGLAVPASGEESAKAWNEMKGLELDFGPRPKKKGTPGLDRITANLQTNSTQYLHALLFLMVLRAFLFRSIFACLPWLISYQFLSVFLPLDSLEKLPQLPLEKVPVEFRIVATIVLNALVHFFFLYELVWKTYFYEKIPLIGVIVYHAYAFRPVEA